jgi:hypothetical protein
MNLWQNISELLSRLQSQGDGWVTPQLALMMIDDDYI